MKVLALTEGPNHVCYRYRIEAFAAVLADLGWTLESLPLSPHTFQRSGQIRKAASADVVVLQRKLLPLWQLRMLRRVSRRLLYDFDDALFHRDSYSRKGSASWARLAHFWATIHTADAVTAGNSYLRDQAGQFIAPERVWLVPTCVNPRLYRPAEHARRNACRLVWIGQHSTLPCLSVAQPLLAACARRVARLTLHVICNQFPRLADIEVVPRPWSAATEADDLAACDVGISWLPDDPWSLGKCGLKVLQYMAAGLPVVANPVGMNREMVLDGQTGFIAETPAEWAAAVERLARDPDLRCAMGAAGRARIERLFSVDRWAGQFARLVDALGQTSDPAEWPRRDSAAPVAQVSE